MGPDYTKVIVHSDRAGQHRAIATASKLYGAGLWDGNSPIYFPKPFETHRKVSYEGANTLEPGVDYQIDPQDLPEVRKVRLDQTTVKGMALQLEEEGWRFIPATQPGKAGFWFHSDSNLSVNCNGGVFASYEDATERAYHSEVRRTLYEDEQ